MKKLAVAFISVLLLFLASDMDAQAQDSVNNFKKQFDQHFRYASRVLSLAKAMPAESYSWRPEKGVSSVEEVYTHIARYNYYYLQNSLGIPAPENVDVDQIESITGKRQVVDILERSIAHVQSAIKDMPAAKLRQQTELYGREVNGQAVLMQLITHMSEHVGQSIAYARVNGVVPPWNR